MRLSGLDILRAVAVLLVMGNHLILLPGLALPHVTDVVLRTWHEGGWVGVDLFFVLSGYLISGRLFEEHEATGRIAPGRFLTRRAFKIYPSFWVLLAFSSCLWNVRGQFHAKTFCSELFFVQNYFPGMWVHTWSLAVEEHFYIGLCLLLAILATTRRPDPFDAVEWIFLPVAVGCLWLRLHIRNQQPAGLLDALMFPTHLRVDSLMYGVLLARLVRQRRLPSWLATANPIALGLMGVLCLSPAFLFTRSEHSWVLVQGFTLFYLGSGFLILAAVRMRHNIGRISRSFAAVGAASYSIYLWHAQANVWAFNLWKWLGVSTQTFPLYALAYMVIALGFGMLLAYIVEYPVLMLRERMVPMPDKAVGVATFTVRARDTQCLEDSSRPPSQGFASQVPQSDNAGRYRQGNG